VLLILPLLCPKPFPQQTRYDRQAGAAETATIVCERLWVSAPSTII
jgi:hypothetical protein